MNRWNTAIVLISLSLLTLASPASAQTVYRIVGPDGRVTFSDKPPAANSQAKVSTAAVGGGSGAAGAAALPLELRQVVARYPVTLYTSADCIPCNSGRALLSSRGVPFSERTISTPQDAAALQRLSGDGSVPFLTLGGQRIKGFSDVEWSQYLDAAGYPRTSVLPASYRNPEPSPLVVVQKPEVANADARGNNNAASGNSRDGGTSAPAATDAANPSAPNPSNPAGITF